MREGGVSRDARPVIAIDGPAGAGKSTVAERLAVELGLPYVNTGLMYRAVARRALDESVDVFDEDGLAAIAKRLAFQLGTTTPQSLLIDGNTPDPALMLPDVESVVSEVSRHPRLREVLRRRQRSLGAGGAVMEGRDIGTAVFPDADVKIFVSATVGARANRALERRIATEARDELDGDHTEIVTRRDALDARTTPLEPAPDATVLDTTVLGRDETFRRALAIARSALASGTRRPTGESQPSEQAPISQSLARVAVIGRQNVGKSTLINRLAGRKVAIEDERPGVTRDRVDVEVGWGGHSFVLTDTGGFARRARGVEARAARQADRAVEAADLVLLVVDAQTGVTDEDAVLAGRLQRARAPVLLVANKCDSETLEMNSAEFIKLGIGEPVSVSAMHGRGTGELLDRIVARLGLPRVASRPQVDGELRTCLIGRPNVGKSSLFNRLVREERAVVHEEPGTTRDAVDSLVSIDGRSLRFIDTAGLRRQVKTRGLEYYGLVRSLRAIERSHVAILVVDASQGVTSEDKRIAAQVAASGRGLVAVLNKWDLVPSEERDRLFRDLGRRLAIFPGTPVVRTSALRGLGLGRVVPALLAVHEAWSRRVPTAAVNREIEAALASYPPPRGVGRIRYGTQVSVGPPSFVLFGATVPGNAYRRYLENRLRRAFGFDGVPVRISFRTKGSR